MQTSKPANQKSSNKPSQLRQAWRRIVYLPRLPLLWSIRLYQKTLSPDHGPLRSFFPNGYCRFYPSCSEYGYRAIKQYGMIKGSMMAAWRIVRCNPWSKGGNDDVPARN